MSHSRPTEVYSALHTRLHEEAAFGRLPRLGDEQELTPLKSIGAGINAGMVGWCLLVGGYAANVMDARRGATALLTGSICSVVLMTLAMTGCNRYGCDVTDLNKTCLGQRGAKLLLLLLLLCQLTWSALILAMFGQGMQSLWQTLGLAWPIDLLRVLVSCGMLSAWLLARRGASSIAFLQNATTPGVLMTAALVLYVVLREMTFVDLMRVPPLIDVTQTESAGIAAFTCGLGSGFCGWPKIAALSRNAKTPRASIYPQILTMGLLTGLMATIGLWAALLFRSFNPNDWLAHIGGTAFSALTLTCFACTHLAGAAAQIFSIAHALRHVRYLRRLSWNSLTGLPVALLAPLLIAPSYVYAHGHILLILTAYALTPTTCVLALDYLVLRRQRINLSQIYDDSRHAIYWYWGGINRFALASIASGIAVGLIVLNPITHTVHPAWHGLGGAPLGGLVATALHALSVHFVLRPRGLGGYRAPTAPQAILYYNL